MSQLFDMLSGGSWARRLAPRRTLLRTAVRGGLLRLNGMELIYGEGFLGSRNSYRAPLSRLVSLTINPGAVAVGGVNLCISIADEPDLLIEGVNAAAAERLIRLVEILRNQ
ncbi:MAG: hypothetical protein MI924_03795 [Chloroflexales bacterium]|nr:hypothetical protein [Chloroflexales bacterium]